MSVWPFTNYVSQIDWGHKPAEKLAQIKPLPKRDLPTPKQEPKTDRIKRANSKV